MTQQYFQYLRGDALTKKLADLDAAGVVIKTTNKSGESLTENQINAAIASYFRHVELADKRRKVI